MTASRSHAARPMGVEEELLLVDAATGEPLGLASPVQAASAADDLDIEMRAEQIETGSAPQTDAAALAADLRRRRESARDAARAQGATVAAVATSPVAPGPATQPSGRYAEIGERFGAVASAQLTNGQHVHVEVASPEEGVGVLDRIGPWLPVLRALAADSPFWRGHDTGYASYRTVVWNRWPSAGPSPTFGSVAAYDAAVAAMLATDTLLDEAMVYFDARLSRPTSTVEVRVADVCTALDDAVLIAVLARALVTTAAAAWSAGSPPPEAPVEALRLAHWRAARSGLADTLVDPRTGQPAPAATVVDALRTHVADALADAGDEERAALGCARLLREGTGADRQRAALTGGADLCAVTLDAVARTFA